MNKKTLLILFGIFIILGIAASYSWWGQYVDFYKKSSSDTELNFSVLSEKSIEKISVRKNGEEEKTIVKEHGIWKINEFNADQEEVSSFFDSLSELTVGSLVSKNPDNHGNFGVTEDKGTILALHMNDTESIFIIGERGATFNSFYARAKNSNNVYEISGDLRDKISRNVTAWRDKTIVNIPKESISKIEVDSASDSFVLSKENDVWNAMKDSKTETLDEAIRNRLLATLNPLEASGFLDEEEKKEFENAKDKTIIRVYGDEAKNLATINLFEKNGEWWGEVEGKTVFHKIPAYKLSDIFLKDEDIFGTK